MQPVDDRYEHWLRKSANERLRQACLHLERRGEVHEAFGRLRDRLQELNVPYATAGDMAMFAHGYRRSSLEIAVLVSHTGAAMIREHASEWGLRVDSHIEDVLVDEATELQIDLLIAGTPVDGGGAADMLFPDPATAVVNVDGIPCLTLPILISLKLVSRKTNRGWLKDLADVQELIRVLKLPANFALELHEYARKRFRDLWQAVQDDASTAD